MVIHAKKAASDEDLIGCLDNLRCHNRHVSTPSFASCVWGDLADGRSNAVVNSVGALQYLVASRFSQVIYVQRALLAPAFMAIALPEGSPLKRPIDRALIKITAGPEWKTIEELYFGQFRAIAQ